MSTKISIIIPVLNEGDTISQLLEHLVTTAFAKANMAEIIVVDGGSTDDTCAQVEAMAQITTNLAIQTLKAPKGRAKQMNAGAKMASGSILYFLHADSFPPPLYDQLIIDEVYKGNLAGCFRMRFDSSHWWLKFTGWLTRFDWRACRGGDQSQFIDASLFHELGGFDEQFIIYEDNDLINKLYERSEFTVIPAWLTTSARRYTEQGVWTLQYHFLAIYFKKWLGASAQELHQYYLKKVAS